MFCTLSKRLGSKLPLNFIAPIELSRVENQEPSTKLRTFFELEHSAVSGAVSPSGHFIATVTDGMIHLLSLQAAFEGGLCGFGDPISCKCGLVAGASDRPAISISIKECSGALDVSAVDGEGHMIEAHFNVPNMLAPDAPAPRRQQVQEPLSNALVFQLYSNEPGQAWELPT